MIDVLSEFISWALNVAQNGFGAGWLAIMLLQVVIGLFFACSGFNKLFNRGRHAIIAKTMQDDHIPFPRFNEWFVPGNEFVGGIMLMLNIFPVFFASALVILLCVACYSEARGRVAGYQPINAVDALCDYLYLPEVIYLVGLAVIILH